jgi:IS5 family transposase
MSCKPVIAARERTVPDFARARLFARTIGIAKATTKIGMANRVYNLKRVLFLQKRALA